MSNKINELPWKPWKLNSINAPGGMKSPLDVLLAATAPADVAVEKPAIDPAEVQRIHQQAQEQGFQQGLEQGKQEGYQQAYQQGLQEGIQAGHQQGVVEAQQQQQLLTEQWQKMVTDFQQTLDALDSVIASRLMQMALTAAKQILGHAPLCDGTALLTQIQQMIQQEPMFRGKPQLRVNPKDFDQVEQQLGTTLNLHGWRLLADNQIHVGGCKVSAEDGDIDATLATRWQELCRLAAPGEM
jgi:flagellar assembly protein FliH